MTRMISKPRPYSMDFQLDLYMTICLVSVFVLGGYKKSEILGQVEHRGVPLELLKEKACCFSLILLYNLIFQVQQWLPSVVFETDI